MFSGVLRVVRTSVRAMAADNADNLVEVTVDGQAVKVPPGTTILQVIFLPSLLYLSS